MSLIELFHFHFHDPTKGSGTKRHANDFVAFVCYSVINWTFSV